MKFSWKKRVFTKGDKIEDNFREKSKNRSLERTQFYLNTGLLENFSLPNIVLETLGLVKFLGVK